MNKINNISNLAYEADHTLNQYFDLSAYNQESQVTNYINQFAMLLKQIPTCINYDSEQSDINEKRTKGIFLDYANNLSTDLHNLSSQSEFKLITNTFANVVKFILNLECIYAF